MNVGEFYVETVLPMYDMFVGEQRLFLDRKPKLVPVTDSFLPPAWYNWLLMPFSDRKVQPPRRLLAPRESHWHNKQHAALGFAQRWQHAT